MGLTLQWLPQLLGQSHSQKMINYKLTPDLASAQILSVASHLSCSHTTSHSTGHASAPQAPCAGAGVLTCHLSPVTVPASPLRPLLCGLSPSPNLNKVPSDIPPPGTLASPLITALLSAFPMDCTPRAHRSASCFVFCCVTFQVFSKHLKKERTNE